MRFCQQLNAWMVLTGCRASERCARPGVAAPSLSRYRAGERTPGRDSAALDGLCRGLAELAQERGIPGMAEAEVRAGFLSCEEYAASDRVQLRENFNTLVEVMELSISRLCRYANYDPSTVFRFRSGARQPADPVGFAGAVAAYVSRELDDVQHREIAGRMYADYPAVFAGDARIDARSTTVVRCVLSMAAFCERLKELSPDLQITRTAGIRNTRIFNFFNAQANPGVSPEYLALPKSRAWRQAGEEFRASRIDPSRLLGRLFTAEYAPRVKQPQQLLQMLNNTRASLHGLDLEVSLDDLFTADELYALWESDNRDFYLFRGPNPATGRYPEYLAKVLLEDLLDRADRAIASGTPAADLRFGHDANLMTLLNLMQFGGCSTAASTPDAIAEVWRNYRISPMAANLQLVFYRRKGSDEVLVKMLHNEREVRIPLASDTAP